MYYTLKQIRDAFNYCVDCLKSINVDNDQEFINRWAEIKEQLINTVLSFRIDYPELFFLNYPETMEQSEADKIIARIGSRAISRYSFPPMPSGDYFCDSIQGELFYTPKLMRMESDIHLSISQENLMSWLLGILIIMPIGSVKIRFIDVSGSNFPDFFYANINPLIYNEKPIVFDKDIHDCLNELNERVLTCIQKYGNLPEYQELHKSLVYPYEVIVLLDNSIEAHSESSRLLQSLKNNGEKGGVYIVSINLINESAPSTPSALYPSHITSIPTLTKSCIQYVNNAATRELKEKVIPFDLSYFGDTYTAVDKTIEIPVGKSGHEKVYFCLDIISHIHAFVVGQSGSGKSVFLHNIVSGAMLKYSPEDFELYLLDFKLGGVEFNRYRGEKHVHALLVDNSDPQITLEILRELKGRMVERGKMMRKMGVTSIEEYNNIASERIPHILFVADECHELFHEYSNNDTNRRISLEISEIMAKIAKEGRNQGIHLLLATQTLSGTNINPEILHNISDFYLLKCSETDSAILLSDSRISTTTLSPGHLYYSHQGKIKQFTAFFINHEETDKVMSAILDRAAQVHSKDYFYFNGAEIFSLNRTIIEKHQTICKKNPVAFLGKSIDLHQKDVYIALKKDYSENILVLGQNDDEQCTRVSISIINSFLLSRGLSLSTPKIVIFDCFQDIESQYYDVFMGLEENENIEFIEPRDRAQVIKQLAEDIKTGHAEETILIIIGQDRFRELKMKVPFDDTSIIDDFTSVLSLDSSPREFSTIDQAFSFILDKGPEQGIHTILQLEKISNFLFSDYLSHKDLFQKFKHLVLLRSDETTSMSLHLRDDIHLELLSKEAERLRAYYYSEEKDLYTLFTPFSIN